MRIARIGVRGSERPAVISGETVFFVDAIISDWSPSELENDALKKVRGCDLSTQSSEPLGKSRIGPPIHRPSKVICVGLNYLGHIKEAKAETPAEPIIFMKAPETIQGPNDDIVIPPGSTSTDYEVELAVVIGKRALYLEKVDLASEVILGYTISQDVSERHWQLERSGQWMKGKSFPTFNPIGPAIVTQDEINSSDCRLWCSVDGEMRQDSNTSDLLFGINHLVWYISQFMELVPGDVINTGTPYGVGLGFAPPKYLRPGNILRTGIEGIGEMQSSLIAFTRNGS